MFKKSAGIHNRDRSASVTCLSLILIVCLSQCCFAESANSRIIWFGDIDPADPTTWTSSTLSYIGKDGLGAMVISDSYDLLSSGSYIGYEAGSTGIVTVSGAGSTWTLGHTENLYVGRAGNGTLNITNGGAVHSDLSSLVGNHNSSVSAVKVDGAGSTWTAGNSLVIGPFGNGTLDITGGGAANCTHGYIGLQINSTGKATVDGPGSIWTSRYDFYAGNEGSCELNIQNGGTLSCGAGHIGASSHSISEVTVDGPGSKWTSHCLYVGENGIGTLNITDGGKVTSDSQGYVGRFGLRPNKAIVEGAGSTWISNNLYVGSEGSGTLDITNMGLVMVSGKLSTNIKGRQDSFINMATGGMLALNGDAHNSLDDFLGLVDGTDAIRYWDDSISDWADIKDATCGSDYTLNYMTTGVLNGYTVLTVGVPEPSTLVGLLGLCLIGLLVAICRRWQ